MSTNKDINVSIWNLVLDIEEKILLQTPEEACKKKHRVAYIKNINATIKTTRSDECKEILIRRREFIINFDTLNKRLGGHVYKADVPGLLNKINLLEKHNKYLKKNKAKLEKYQIDEEHIRAPNYHLLSNWFEHLACELYNFAGKNLSTAESSEDTLSLTENQQITNFFLKACHFRGKEKELLQTKEMCDTWNKYAEHLRKLLANLRDQKWIKQLPPEAKADLEGRLKQAEIDLKPIFKNTADSAIPEATNEIPVQIHISEAMNDEISAHLSEKIMQCLASSSYRHKKFGKIFFTLSNPTQSTRVALTSIISEPIDAMHTHESETRQTPASTSRSFSLSPEIECETNTLSNNTPLIMKPANSKQKAAQRCVTLRSSIRHAEEGESLESIAKKFRISPELVQKTIKGFFEKKLEYLTFKALDKAKKRSVNTQLSTAADLLLSLRKLYPNLHEELDRELNEKMVSLTEYKKWLLAHDGSECPRESQKIHNRWLKKQKKLINLYNEGIHSKHWVSLKESRVNRRNTKPVETPKSAINHLPESETQPRASTPFYDSESERESDRTYFESIAINARNGQYLQELVTAKAMAATNIANLEENLKLDKKELEEISTQIKALQKSIHESKSHRTYLSNPVDASKETRLSKANLGIKKLEEILKQRKIILEIITLRQQINEVSPPKGFTESLISRYQIELKENFKQADEVLKSLAKLKVKLKEKRKIILQKILTTKQELQNAREARVQPTDQISTLHGTANTFQVQPIPTENPIRLYSPSLFQPIEQTTNAANPDRVPLSASYL